MEDEYVIHPVKRDQWQVWKNGQLVKDSFNSANEAWNWIDDLENPIPDIPGFKVKGKVR